MKAATVFIVHDEPSLRKLLRIRLEEIGIPVRENRNIHRAIEEFGSFADEIVAVVSGVRMSGVGGMELLTALRSVRPDLPIYFFTSVPLAEDGPLPAGVEVFRKPQDLTALIRAIQDVVPVESHVVERN
jgi:two-component system, LuxR family, response regulator FixJ